MALDRVEGQAGDLAFTGEYRYEPGTARPHRLRVRAAEVDAADLEQEFAPTLARRESLIARALGRASLPDWLKGRGVDGTVQVDSLLVGPERVWRISAGACSGTAPARDGQHLEQAGARGRKRQAELARQPSIPTGSTAR